MKMKERIKDKKYINADLISTFKHCPCGELNYDCPFIVFCQLGNELKSKLLASLSESNLEMFQTWYGACFENYQRSTVLRNDK